MCRSVNQVRKHLIDGARRGHAPRSDNITAVGQLVGDTIIAEGEFMLYPVTRAAVCTEAVYPGSAN